MLMAAEQRRAIVPRLPGRGKLELARVAGRTVVTAASATSPLKLLTPKRNAETACVFTSTYGGGLLGGDCITLDVVGGKQTQCVLTTQSSTKIYRTTGPTSRQTLHASVDDDAVLIIAPDPLVCFAHSKYEQNQSFDLSPEAALVLIDSFTSGRRARGERWAVQHYRSRCEVNVNGSCVFRDHLILDPSDGAIETAMRMGSIDCFATLLLIGPALSAVVSDLLAERRGPLLFSVSPVAGGAVVRIAGDQTESIMAWIREKLRGVWDLVGHDPWSRKM
jgi:urease accessory protein